MTGELDRSALRRALGSRTAPLPGTPADASDRLADTSVLVVGAGGLGSPVIALLAGAGLGRLTIVDPDTVDATNLGRQTLFASGDVGRPKAVLAAEHAARVDPSLEARSVVGRFEPELVEGHDVVVDAADATPVTRSVSDACAARGVPWVWGSVLGFDGQASAFWDRSGIDFHDVYPQDIADVGSCAVDGVLAPLCQALGSVMAAQVLALRAGIGAPLLGTVLSVDASVWEWSRIPVRRGPHSVRPGGGERIEHIAPDELAALLTGATTSGSTPGAARPVVVDVRTAAERAVDRVPGSIVPDDLPEDLPADALVVVVCERGKRARAWAASRPSDPRIRVLDGGMEAWRTVPRELVQTISNPLP